MQESTHTGFVAVHGTVQHLIGHMHMHNDMQQHNAYAYDDHVKCIYISKHVQANAHLQMPIRAAPSALLCLRQKGLSQSQISPPGLL